MNEKVEDIKKNQKLKNIKSHLKNNKAVYIAAGVGFVAGGLTVLALGRNSEIKQIVDAYKIQICTRTINNISATLIARGHPGFVVMCKETGEQWASINQAAAINGISVSNLRQHLSGKYPHAGGLTYEILGKIPV